MSIKCICVYMRPPASVIGSLRHTSLVIYIEYTPTNCAILHVLKKHTHHEKELPLQTCFEFTDGLKIKFNIDG